MAGAWHDRGAPLGFCLRSLLATGPRGAVWHTPCVRQGAPIYMSYVNITHF